MEYAYPHFRRELLREDASFQGGPAPGDPFPDFDLPRLGGGRLRRGELLGRPFLFLFASFT